MRILNKRFNRTNNHILQFACKSCACDAGCNCNINTNPYTHIQRSKDSKKNTNDIFLKNDIEFK